MVHGRSTPAAAALAARLADCALILRTSDGEDKPAVWRRLSRREARPPTFTQVDFEREASYTSNFGTLSIACAIVFTVMLP